VAAEVVQFHHTPPPLNFRKESMYNFTDAQDMHIKYPDKFYAPSIDELDKIKVKDFIKVCHNSERFWIEIIEINGKVIKGRIDNDLVAEQPFKCDDIIECEKQHIYNILPPC
jgi:hypothetical protein